MGLVAMNGYRRGAVFGLTVAEIFILLTFLLLIALLGLIQEEETLLQPDTPSAPRVWVRPEEIQTLVNAAKEASKAQEESELARVAAERERDQAQEKVEEASKAQEESELARIAAERERDQAQEESELARAAAVRERDQAQEKVEEARKTQEESELARIAAERERDQAQEEAELAHAAAERERDQARRDLALLRRKGENPPCWYKTVSVGKGKTRERRHYVFNVAIYEDSIELAPRTAPPGGAFDDGGGTYADEWKRLQIEDLLYGNKLSDNEFTEAVSDLVAQGKNRQVRTYECVFSVMVWDMTPVHAKKRWKDVHDNLIENFFNAYTVQDIEWKGIES